MGDRQALHRRGHSLALAGICALAVSYPVRAQEGDGGLKLTFGVSSTLRSDSNLSLANPSRGRATTFQTDLSFGLESRTRVSALSLGLSTVARAASLPAPGGKSAGIEDPTLTFAYAREGARSRLQLTARYNRADLDYVDPLTDPVLVADPTAPGGFVLVSSSGTRTNKSVGLGFETGIDTPFGFKLQLDRRNLDYSGTVSPSLYDTRTTSGSTELRFDVTPTTRFTVTAAATNYTASDVTQIDRRNRSLSFGVVQVLDEATTLTASIGRSRVETDRTIAAIRTTAVQQGTTFTLGATRDIPVGNVGLTYARSIDTTGSRDTLQVSHQHEFRTSALNLSLGLTRGTAGTTAVVANAAFRQDLPSGRFTLSLARSVATNDLLQDVLATRATANYTHEITDLSSIALGASYARSEDGGAGAFATTSRSGLSVTYSRSLTEDWGLNAGYEYRRATTTTGPARSNALFVTIGRSFEIRP